MRIIIIKICCVVANTMISHLHFLPNSLFSISKQYLIKIRIITTKICCCIANIIFSRLSFIPNSIFYLAKD